ncbi:phage tail spike protein [Clostridium perfringens]|uniref:phage tail spike protein n=1 Tax=Clostridium perfringens TaxID=1502 RepID=UPI00244CC9BA|nr:phage tail spike protein [Clostridium perfringens]MDH2460370.1 phage tail spike protein [Clostridium perfringens]
MLQLFDKNKRKIAGLIEYENLCIESILESGDKTLSFSYSTFSKFHDEIEEETYIRTKNDEYVVKAKLANSKDNKTAFTCKLNIEELEGNIFDRFETVEKNIIDCLNQAIVSTGWTINTENCTNKKKRTIRITNCSSWTIIQKAKKLYGIEFKFYTLNKVIMLYDRIGTDKGTYFIDSLNLRALQTQGNSYGFYTRIIPTGKNGLTIASVNGGKIYLENKQYSNKTLTYYWKDERYVKPDSLKEDALEKLNIMSKPFKSYIASTINLVEMNEKYKSILDYNLGDYIYLISKKNNIKDKHRIVKTKEYPQDHSKDTVELANKALDLSEEKLLVDEMNTTLDNVTTDNGTLNGSTIDSIQVKQIEDFRANVIEVVNLKAINASIENLHANKADIQDLNAVKARIGTLEATKANITQLTAVSAEVQQLNAIKANITDLNAATAKIGILEAKTASIDNLLAGNLTADNFKANSITAGSGIIASGAIGSAQISSLSVNKLEAGDITTSKHKIVSADGTIEIVGNQILINRNNVNRVILGEYRKSDGTTEYGLLVRAKDGQTIMLDGNGVHNAGITDGAIDNNKVADNANISGNKLDINSVIREVNNNGTETIKGTKVTVGDRTLDVELSTQKNTITEHGKELSSQKATIQALDNAIKLKVDTQTFTQSTTTINNNINRAKEEAINSANSNTTNAINNIKFGGRNYYLNSSFNKTLDNWSTNDPIIIIKDGYLIMDARNITGPYLDTQQTFNVDGEGIYTMSLDVEEANGTCYMYAIDKTDTDAVQPYTDNCFTLQGKKRNFKVIEGRKGTTRFWSVIRAMKGSYLKCRLAKFEKGNKCSDWTPAPEDVQAYADSKKNEAIIAAENLALEKSNLAKKYAEDVATAKANLAKTEAIANADSKITEEERKRIQQAQENLNTAISKADKAKQDAILEANRVAELKKQEAINSANSHADNKANEALNNAKAFVNAEITTVNSHLNKATSEINVLKEKIESKVSQSDIDKSIQNIKFNDVNMILNSGEFKDTDHWSCTNGSNNLTIENRILKFKFTNYASWGCYISNNSLLNKPLDISKKYTVVCKLKASKNQILTFNICDGNSYNYVFGKELSLTTEWQIFKFTFNPTQVGNERQFRFITSNLGYDFDLYIEFVKMVEGATSSDSWSMAPDYVLDNIKTVTDKISTVESKLTQENNSIKASVQDLNSTTQTITTNINNINRDLTSKISSNLDVAKSFATDIATNKANTAKQEAINSSNSHADSIAASKATEALNNAKTYINAEISTVNTKVNNVESNLNILSDRINSKVSQSDIDKAVTTIRTEKIIYARGTGNDFPSNALVKVNGKTITDGQGRGLRINALNKVTLERVFLQDYDTFGSEDAKVSFVNKINELNNGDYIIIITSQDASYPLHPPIKEALEKIGATLFDNKQGTYREAYALIGKSKLGRGNGVEMFIPRTANDKRFAEVSVKVGEDGTFIGVNPNNMGLEATLITSNISDVSSELTQTKNSIEASINSINSKTQSIETNLNGKATKQEVTEVNNRVATIKANLDSITQRVSNTESKTNSLETNINGKASKQELTVVNNKVTEVTASLNGITQRVGNTESRINALDGKVAGAVTLQQFTEFKQSNDKFKFTVEQRSSVSNILPNSSFFGGDRGWLHDGVEFWYGSYSGYGFKGRMTGAIKNRTSYNNPERFLQTHKAYKVKKNTTYTISFHYACEMNIHSMEAYVVLSDTEHGDYAQPIRILEKPGGTQSDPNNDIPFTYKFNTGNHEWVWLRFDHNGMKPGTNWDQYCWLYVSEIGIYEGDVGAVKWTPKGGEVYSANYQMDGLGFKGTFEDGTYAQLGRDGFEWYNAGTGHAYHALTYVTSFDVPIGNPGKAYIKLPAEFTKRRSSLKWTVALRGYYYNTTGNFFPFHVHCTGARDYIENGLVVCEVQGLCKIQNGSNSGDVQFRPLTAMLIAIA